MVDENTFSEKRIIITILLIVVFYTFFVVFSDLDKIQKIFSTDKPTLSFSYNWFNDFIFIYS